MALKSITQRWFLNSFGVIFVILVMVVGISGVTIRNSYYASVREVLSRQASTVDGMLIRYSENTVTSNFYIEIRSYVESFPDKNVMELMTIDPNGQVTMTSSGFSYEKRDFPDYTMALNSAEGEGYYVGMSGGQKIMALTRMVTPVNSEFSAMRFVVSLERVDAAIRNMVLLLSAAALAVLGLVLISGLFFVKSIVRPVRAASKTARRIASGDFKTRIERVSNDELGELCQSINFMADELENTEKMKNEFISSVSHELRTPLTAIKGWAETLLDTDNYDAATLKKGMRVISAETERLSGMVEELLDFSRIQNGRFSLVFQKMDLLAELGEAVLMYTEKARREDIQIIYNEPEMLPIIYGDKNRLRQVFINVIDNAIKYSDPGDTVKIDAFRQGDNIVITVADTGCGISPEDLPKIKTKFFKANQTRRGSGIGLAVASEIIQMHNGTIDIESTLNVGTTVLIHLPIQRQEGNTERNIENEQQG